MTTTTKLDVLETSRKITIRKIKTLETRVGDLSTSIDDIAKLVGDYGEEHSARLHKLDAIIKAHQEQLEGFGVHRDYITKEVATLRVQAKKSKSWLWGVAAFVLVLSYWVGRTMAPVHEIYIPKDITVSMPQVQESATPVVRSNKRRGMLPTGDSMPTSVRPPL